MTENLTSIYVIGRAGRPLKVGLAVNPKRRLCTLQTGHSAPISLIYCRAVPREIASDVERRAHWILREGATHGEWFSVSVQAAKDAVDCAVETRGAGEKALSSVGRPPLKKGLKVKQAAVWLHEDLLQRIKDVVGKQGFSEFMRDAAIAELKRRDRTKPKASPTPKPDDPRLKSGG